MKTIKYIIDAMDEELQPASIRARARRLKITPCDWRIIDGKLRAVYTDSDALKIMEMKRKKPGRKRS